MTETRNASAIIEELIAYTVTQDQAYTRLLERHDDALKRIADLQAELEYLRNEQGRRVE